MACVGPPRTLTAASADPRQRGVMHSCLHVILDLLAREAAPDSARRLCRQVRFWRMDAGSLADRPLTIVAGLPTYVPASSRRLPSAATG